MKKLAILVLILILPNPIIANWNILFRGVSYELMYLRMDDGKLLRYSTYNKREINMRKFHLFITKKGYTVSQIKIVIHNHMYSPQFSDGDKDFYRSLYNHDFKGKFQIFFRGKVFDLKEDYS